MPLESAHHGYLYQDIFSACLLAQALRQDMDQAVVDLKRFRGDVFDDLELGFSLGFRRLQFKSHTSGKSELDLTDLGPSGRLPLAGMLHTLLQDDRDPDELRVCATWTGPTPALNAILRRADASPSLSGSRASIFALDPDLVWPPDGAPLLDGLREHPREKFVDLCARLTLEFGTPHASLEFAIPGPLERMLMEILRDQLGIGYPPNHMRNAEDAALALIHAVTQARAGAAEHVIRREEVLRVLALQTDFGRLPEEFPVDERSLVTRTAALDALMQAADCSGCLVVVGGPGSGKSHLLRSFLELSRASGKTVGIHYLYLDLLDTDLQRRSELDTMFGSLLAELRDSLSTSALGDSPLYSARPTDLVDSITAALANGQTEEVVLLVDGLDHATRIRPSAVGQMCAGEEVAQALAELELPPGVTLVVGSQPGNHLAPLLERGKLWEMPAWDDSEVELLAANMGVTASIDETVGGDEGRDVMGAIVERSSGNPLYATYLLREVTRALSAPSVAVGDLTHAVEQFPPFDEGLGAYYSLIAKGLEQTTGSPWLAELLALLDFAVSDLDLTQMRPDEAHRVAPALAALAPVLTTTPAGGHRIYHESFQRFMLSAIAEQGADIRAILKPAVSWLIETGFFQDTRAFMSLLRLYQLSKMPDDALAVFDADFVAKAVANGHGYRAISRCLTQAATIAAEQKDWSSLCLLLELARSCETCFESKLIDDAVTSYGRTLSTVAGAESLSKRLVFDGKPVFGHRNGLVLCALCDKQGGPAPWGEYLDAFDRQHEESEEHQGRQADEHLDAALVRGRLRLQPARMLARICEVASEGPESISPPVATLANVVADVLGLDALDEVLAAAQSPGWINTLALEKAKLLLATGDDVAANQALDMMDLEALPASQTRDLVRLHLRSVPVPSGEELRALTDAVLDRQRVLREEAAVSRWLTALYAAAADDPASVAPLELQITASGWYYSWLRYCLHLAQAIVGAESVSCVLRILLDDAHPFAGTPRAIDLYGIREVVHDSIRDGLLLVQDAEWRSAIEVVADVSRLTSATLKRGPSGPLPLEVLIDLLETTSTSVHKAEATAEFLAELLEQGTHEATYYEIHAMHHLALARMLSPVSQADADAAFLTACRYFTAYGFRKDITIYEILDSLVAVGGGDSKWLLPRLADLQRPVESLLVHTDGRSTRQALSEWQGLIAQHDPVGCLRYIAADAQRTSETFDYRLEEVLPSALEALGEPSSLLRLLALVCCVPTPLSTERLRESIESLPVDFEIRALLMRQVIAAGEEELTEAYSTETPSPHRPEPTASAAPLFPPQASFAQVVIEIKRHVWEWSRDEQTSERAAATVGYMIVERSADLDTDQLSGVLADISHASSSHSRNYFLECLAKGLRRHGLARLAAETFVYAYTCCGDGWTRFSDNTSLLRTANELDREAMERVLALEVALAVESNGIHSSTRRTLAGLSALGRGEEARAAWDRATEVICRRLPPTGPSDRVAVAYVPSLHLEESEQRVLVQFILSRMNSISMERRRRAFLALCILLTTEPEAVVDAAPDVLSRDVTATAVFDFLTAVAVAEPEPFLVSQGLEDLLFMLEASPLLFLRTPARALLARTGHTVLSPPPDFVMVQAREPRRGADDRLIAADELWPGFSAAITAVAARLPRDLGLRERMETALGNVAPLTQRSDPGETWLPVAESYEVLVQEAAAGIRARLLADGVIEPDAEDLMSEVLDENPEIDVRFLASRMARPPELQTPMELVDHGDSDTDISSSALAVVTSGEYAGWVRLGHCERETFREGRVDESKKVLLTFSGIVFEQSPIRRSMPYVPGLPEVWLEEYEGPRIATVGFSGPLVGFDVKKNWHGNNGLLCPHPALLSWLCLSLPNWTQGLRLTDEHGDAVVVRTWRTGFGLSDHLNTEGPRYDGADMLIRADLFESFAALTQNPAIYCVRTDSSGEV